MKSYAFIPACLILFFASLPMAMSQVGVKAGPSISDIGFVKYGQSPYLGYEGGMMVHRVPMPTFQGGAFYTLRLGERLAFQPELLFVTQGLDYSTEFLYDDVSYKLKASYLHAPLLLEYQASKKRKWSPFLFGGPYVSRKLKAVRVTVIEGHREKGPMPNVRNMDLGIIAGYAAEFPLPAGALTVGLRTSFSLVNMMSPVEGYIDDYGEGPKKDYARNISIALLVGYRFENLTVASARKGS